MKQLVSFFKYNNAIPIALTLLTLGATSTFAATNPELIIKEEQKVVSIDNTYIAKKNLEKYSPSVKVTSVTEDNDFYYVSYTLRTIDLFEYVWQDLNKNQSMTISKAGLGAYRDLGLYVAEQLNELIAQEQRRLRETQVFEKRAVTTKKIATEYSGIVGGFLDLKTEEFKNYEPVVEPPEPEEEQETFAYPPTPEELAQRAVNERPVVTILGDSYVQLQVGDTYTDLGALADDEEDHSLPVLLLLDGVAVDQILLDTTVARTYFITYRATDSGGKNDEEIRTVQVVGTSENTEEIDTSEEVTATTTEETNTGTSTQEIIEGEVLPPVEEVPVVDENATQDQSETQSGPSSENVVPL